MSQIESQTQRLFIEVARNLFAKRGKKNVTMNDIAAASQKGRRTLYLYFKNKEEIYRAVINNEIQTLHKKVLAVYKKTKHHTKTKTNRIHHHTPRSNKRRSHQKRITKSRVLP